MASPTVRSFSASSSGISMSNSFSNAMTSSTVSRLSAPRSSMKLASLDSFSRSTPSSSTMISLTFSSTLLMSSSVEDCRFASDYHSTVYNQHLPGDVSRQIGRQKQHSPRNILRATQPAQRDLL